MVVGRVAQGIFDIGGNFVRGVATGYQRATEVPNAQFSRSLIRDTLNQTDALIFGDKLPNPKGDGYLRKPGGGFYDIPTTPAAYPDAIEERAGVVLGYGVGDFIGHGSRSMLWNATPQEIASNLALDYGKKVLDQERDMGKIRAISFGTGIALETFSGNLNPTNLAEGGRPDGFSAVEPTEDNARQPVAPAAEFVYRGVLGRRGRLLPWEEFKQDRPDVPYETYEAYREYTFGQDDNPVRNATLGLASATWDGIDGPEAKILGFRLTPEGVAAAGATTLVGTEIAAALLGRRGGRVAKPVTPGGGDV